MKVLIFGAAGQDGPYLQTAAESRGWEVFSSSRGAGRWRCDVGDRRQVHSLLAKLRPGLIFQLAADSTTSNAALWRNHSAIATGTLNVLSGMMELCPEARVLIPGSGLQFRNDGRPISEFAPFEARDPYSLARIHSTYAARLYRSIGLRAVVGYLFHHDSPRRSSRHIATRVVQAATRAAAGNPEVIELDSIDDRREWGYAGDIAEAMLTLACQDDVAEATIGTGEARALREWVDMCFTRVGLSWEPYVRLPETPRPPSILVSDPTTINALGWRPRTSFEQLADMMLTTAALAANAKRD